MRNAPILVVGEHVGDRWDLAWALHEAGIAAEQARSVELARDRLSHGRVAGMVVEEALGDRADELAAALRPDPVTGELPFVLIATRATAPAGVVARVQTLLRAAAASDELKL